MLESFGTVHFSTSSLTFTLNKIIMSNYDPRVTVLSENKYLLGLMTTIRNAQTGSKEFVAAFERVCAYLIPAGKHTPTRLY